MSGAGNVEPNESAPPRILGTGHLLPPMSSAGEELHVELLDPFPGATSGSRDAARVPDTDPTGSHPFPLGEGTGERVVSDLATPEEPTVPRPGNGWEHGTGQRLKYPAGSIPLPLSIQHGQLPSQASPLSLSTPEAGQSSAHRGAYSKAGASWCPLDARGVVLGLQQGTLDRPRPTVGRLADDSSWLYAAAVNGVAGESGCGKTWTALATVAVELKAGRNVVYVDMEDSAIGIISRLLDLGLDAVVLADASRFAYVQPEEAFKDDVRVDFWTTLDMMKPSLVVLDSTGESMALEGTDPNSDDGVARWFQRVARAIADRGPAVLLIDHLPKSDSAASSPIGSQRKRAAISGVQAIQTVRPGMSFAKGRAGEALLTITKDRHGNFVTGEVAMRLIVNPEPLRGESGVHVVLAPVGDEDWAPTRHMLDISKFLEQAGVSQNTGEIKKGVKGKAETLTIALRVLVESGYIFTSQGARNSTVYAHVKPYRIGDSYITPDDDVSGGSAPRCSHEWHTERCNPEWCHPTHHGSCSRLADPLREHHGPPLGSEAAPGSPWDSDDQYGFALPTETDSSPETETDGPERSRRPEADQDRCVGGSHS